MKNKPRTGRPLSPRPPFPSVAQFVEERALTHEHSPFRSANGDYLSKLRMNTPSRCGRAGLVNSLLQLSDDALEELKQVLIVRPILSPARNVHVTPLPVTLLRAASERLADCMFNGDAGAQQKIQAV